MQKEADGYVLAARSPGLHQVNHLQSRSCLGTLVSDCPFY